jgi:hypothetical protein
MSLDVSYNKTVNIEQLNRYAILILKKALRSHSGQKKKLKLGGVHAKMN